ncbi:MAG: phosphoethanolamine--lipid A transferase [Zoogloeaceae bacterium]|jgi:lipid A ethanolaminephosphotransferase|nr:phosphoethanolamine--lipid A transferase [Zoogloeaceae bacterium]
MPFPSCSRHYSGLRAALFSARRAERDATPGCPAARLTLHTETLALLASVAFTLLCNAAFWRALSTLPSSRAGGWWLQACAALLLIGLQWLLLLLVVNRWTVKPLLMLLAATTAAAVYFMQAYGVYLSPTMLRNLVETDIREAGELLQTGMLPYALCAALAIWLLSRVGIRKTRWPRAALIRAACLLAAAALTAAGLWPAAAELLPAFRESKELRYLVTPLNYIASAWRLLADETAHRAAPGPARPREPVAPDARRAAATGASAAARKPLAVVLVIGETVRAANWGMNGYRRQTTPELAARRVINFPHVSSCGTDTATSVPCMFSPNGRRHYDAAAIRRQESLLHVLQRVGVAVRWRENQSGCKGVCDGLPFDDLSRGATGAPGTSGASGVCGGKRCFDEILLDGLPQLIDAAAGDTLIVLHMLGNHGPAYFRRYPDRFRQWTPTCDTTDLAACSNAALVNTYDNAVSYTDHVLAQAITLLSGAASHDTALLYVSDHGESLGEKGLYLHGMPYAIAPAEQTQVPMILWLSPGAARSQGLSADCLARRAALPASHDDLFHTLLKLFEVQTSVYDPQRDLLAGCRETGTEHAPAEPGI